MMHYRGNAELTNTGLGSLFFFIFVSAALIATKLLMDFDALGPGNSWAFLLFFTTFVGAIALGIVRITREQIITGEALLLLSLFVLSFPSIIDEKYWRFSFNRTSYLSLLKEGPSLHPKFMVFNWGNKNTSFGGGFIIEGIVYDESDEIGKAPENRSSEWLQQRSNPLPNDRWVTDIPSITPACRITVRPFGEHFYYLAKEC